MKKEGGSDVKKGGRRGQVTGKKGEWKGHEAKMLQATCAKTTKNC